MLHSLTINVLAFGALVVICTAHHIARQRVRHETVADSFKDFAVHLVLYSGLVFPFPH